jgi:hypothetical protein
MRRRPGAALVALTLALVAGGCAIEPKTTYPPSGTTPQPVGDAVNATKQAVIGALAAAGLQAAESVKPYRPAEGPLLAAAPRSIVQAALPDDPDHGFIAIYALDSPNAALAAAHDQATWVTGPTGRMNFPLHSRFVLRTLGSTVIFFWWLPGSSADARLEQVGPALETIGEGVTIPG